MTPTAVVQPFGSVAGNPLGLDQEVVIPLCSALNLALASFQALYIYR